LLILFVDLNNNIIYQLVCVIENFNYCSCERKNRFSSLICFHKSGFILCSIYRVSYHSACDNKNKESIEYSTWNNYELTVDYSNNIRVLNVSTTISFYFISLYFSIMIILYYYHDHKCYFYIRKINVGYYKIVCFNLKKTHEIKYKRYKLRTHTIKL